MRGSVTVSLIAGALMGGLVGCGGGGGGSAASTTPPTPPAVRTTGFAVPTEISPVATSSAPAGSVRTLLGRALPLAATDPTTDYSQAVTRRYVSEHAIDQFSIIETILNAISQTHYADAGNVNAGPYKSIVTWQENNGGNNNGITTQTWTVDSRLEQANGQDVNVVDAWIEDSGRLIRGEFRITASARQDSDGSYLDYGKWTLNVKFDDGVSYFEALADIDGNGDTILKINNHEDHGGIPFDRQGVVHKGAAAGYGKVYYTDEYNGQPQPATAAYAYNAGQLLVDSGSGGVYKDRTATVDIVQRYGMYRGDTGDDVLASHTFGFPVSFTVNGAPGQGYYGAWQGRHSLWINGGAPIPEGTSLTVTSQDPNRPGTWSTVSYAGTLTKRTLKPADINDLLNLPVEIWANFQHNLQYDGSHWMENGTLFDLDTLVAQPRMNVMISRWTMMGGQQNYVYAPDGPQGAGFYPASMGQNGTWTRSSDTCYSPQSGDNLWVNINGSIFIEYQGSGAWVQKKVTAFDMQTNTPTFDPTGDTQYALTTGFQYYINKQGGNYVVTQTSPGTFDVKVEIQTAANPVNAAALLGTAATFQPQWGSGSTYRFVTDPTSPRFMKLVFDTVAQPDTAAVGDPVTSGQWGLVANDGAQYNWDYPQAGQTFGIQTFLYTGSSQAPSYKLLDDPIALKSLVLTTNGGASRTLSLQFDGWMQGLPQFFDELARNDWNVTDAVAAKVINIPAGTQATDTTATDAQGNPVTYLIKPLEIGVYLKPAAVPDPTLTLGQAQAIQLDSATLPQYSDNGMSSTIPDGPMKYVSGIKVQ